MLHLKLRKILEEANFFFPEMFASEMTAQKAADNVMTIITLPVKGFVGNKLKQSIAGYFHREFARELKEFHIHSVRVVRVAAEEWLLEVKAVQKPPADYDKRKKARINRGVAAVGGYGQSNQ